MSYLLYLDRTNNVLFCRFTYAESIVEAIKDTIPPRSRMFHESLGKSWSVTLARRFSLVRIMAQHGYGMPTISEGSGVPDSLWCHARPSGSDGPGIRATREVFPWWLVPTGATPDSDWWSTWTAEPRYTYTGHTYTGHTYTDNKTTGTAFKVRAASRIRTAHEILFVAADAPKEVITAAYKALAKLYHPDLGGSHEKMVELDSAYKKIKG